MAQVLLVEDDPWMGELYLRVIGKRHKIIWARDGYDAMDSVDQIRPDVIVLDIMLPWVNGIQLLHELAGYDDTSTIPIIIFSAAVPREMQALDLSAYGVRKIIDKSTSKPRQVLREIDDIARAYANHTD